MTNVGRAGHVGQNATINGLNSNNRKPDSHLNYAMYANYCSEPGVVRKYLDFGVLHKMLNEEKEQMLICNPEENKSSSGGPGYEYVFLGACAMTLGCTIPEDHKDAMRKVYMCVGLMHDAVAQMEKALTGSKSYQDGTPWNFGSQDLHATLQQKDMYGKPNPNGLIPGNVSGPGTMMYYPPKGSKEGLNELKVMFAETRYPLDACSGCGSKEGKDNAALLECGGCHKRRYCSKECQKDHWKAAHKQFCKSISKGRNGEELKAREGGWWEAR